MLVFHILWLPGLNVSQHCTIKDCLYSFTTHEGATAGWSAVFCPSRSLFMVGPLLFLHDGFARFQFFFFKESTKRDETR